MMLRAAFLALPQDAQRRTVRELLRRISGTLEGCKVPPESDRLLAVLMQEATGLILALPEETIAIWREQSETVKGLSIRATSPTGWLLYRDGIAIGVGGYQALSMNDMGARAQVRAELRAKAAPDQQDLADLIDSSVAIKRPAPTE